jgi:hypothetical protein
MERTVVSIYVYNILSKESKHKKNMAKVHAKDISKCEGRVNYILSSMDLQQWLSGLISILLVMILMRNQMLCFCAKLCSDVGAVVFAHPL